MQMAQVQLDFALEEELYVDLVKPIADMGTHDRTHHAHLVASLDSIHSASHALFRATLA